jgi:hypothetical protein
VDNSEEKSMMNIADRTVGRFPEDKNTEQKTVTKERIKQEV